MQNLKALISKCWKSEPLDLAPGQHFVDQTISVRVSGSVEKMADEMATPTVGVPLIATLALFSEKCGVTRDHALRMLKEAVGEAMANGTDKNREISARMKDMETAIKSVKRELLEKLPKQKKSGKVITKNLEVEILPLATKSAA